MKTSEYFKQLDKQVKEVYDLAAKTREKGLDPKTVVEIPLARSLAEKCVGLISTVYPQIGNEKIVNRILELEKEYGRLDPAICLKIAEEVAKQKFCKFSSHIEAMEAGIRIAFSYTTLGVVSSPIEGFTYLKIGKTQKGEDYLIPYFSGPVRSAGGTGEAFSLVIVDYLREIFGYVKYDPTEQEIKRIISEIYDYHERITNLQYLPTVEEIDFLARNLPIQVNGEPSEDKEVSNFKDLPRVETNFLRSGVCLTLAEGLAQKAAKILRYVTKLREKGFALTDWDFLKDYVELHKKRDMGKTDSSPTYIKDLVAGRPVFGHPSRSGGFRFRYGRGRNSGFSAFSVHPATMEITDEFIAIGTQLKIEKPTKGGVVSVCDSIDGPIVKLYNGSVKKLKTIEEAKKLYRDVEEIIYLGDILFPFSDLANRNQELVKPGYVEEWWNLELKEKGFDEKIDYFDVSFDKAIELSKKYGIPLHPKYIFYWNQISNEEFFEFLNWLNNSRFDEKIIFPYGKFDQDKFKIGKRALELLGVEHDVTIENVVLSKENSKALFANLGLDFNLFDLKTSSLELVSRIVDLEKIPRMGNVLSVVNELSEFEIKDKAGEFIGTRMARPEKSKPRKLVGSPHMLFPVGGEGGRLRSLQESCKVGRVKGDFPLFYCEDCKKETIYLSCETCGKLCKRLYNCPECGMKFFVEKCIEHGKGLPFSNRALEINYYFDRAVENLNFKKDDKIHQPELIKGVRGTSSKFHTLERLEKGFARAIFNLNVNKDGTIRFDCTEMPLTHFKPKEIGVSIEKLIEMGYEEDIYRKKLENENQILELKPHDILLPCCPESPDERADDVFISISKFIDFLLDRFYKLPKFYNIKKREDLVGQLAVCMAPHNCAGVISRIIGFSQTQGLLASPYMHAAMRRDCDGDEAAIMLLADVLINFSRDFLPGHRGGTQDAPLVLNAKIDAGEVDEQILDFELVNEYPLDLYRKSEKGLHSSQVEVYFVKNALKDGRDAFVDIGFTHNTEDINKGVLCSSYKKLGTMQEKVQHQMELVEKLRCVDTSDVARLIIERHFIRDIRGNLRRFSQQEFRCVKCNTKFRRPPLVGNCTKCGGKLIFTINEGGIIKYLQPTLDLINKYNVSPYIKQSVEITKDYIESVFGKEKEKQIDLKRWF